MRVLIAEDDANVRALLRELVEELEDDVLECADGHDAVALCRLKKPDLVLMDICMPEMNGIEATRRITAMHDDIRVLIVTQHNTEMYRRSAREAGAVGYFLKDDLFPLQDYLRESHGVSHAH